MKGFILAAGLGTRLKPWTDTHPKALVPVGGIPMLERVVDKFFQSGISDITVNCFHFADQIKDFITSKGWKINIVDESPELLETGGAILNASRFLAGDEPILVHNVDILSNADFKELERDHLQHNSMATLLVSNRESSRKLIFNQGLRLEGWHNLTTGEFRPSNITDNSAFSEYAFSGIYIISPAIIEEMRNRGWHSRFSIMEFFLTSLDSLYYKGHLKPDLQLIDIGKPDSLKRANEKFNGAESK